MKQSKGIFLILMSIFIGAFVFSFNGNIHVNADFQTNQAKGINNLKDNNYIVKQIRGEFKSSDGSYFKVYKHSFKLYDKKNNVKVFTKNNIKSRTSIVDINDGKVHDGEISSIALFPPHRARLGRVFLITYIGDFFTDVKKVKIHYQLNKGQKKLYTTEYLTRVS